MLQLNNVKKLVKKTKRIGRGGSRGGTSGKGNKGQKARSGGAVRPGFEGGQMPLFRRLPKRGFTNAIFKSEIEIISLTHLDMFDNGTQVDKALLVEHGIIKSKISRRGSDLQLKVLGNGALSKKLIVVVDACSQSAKEAIEKLGGEVRLIKEM